jgi:PAS domain S-box-containing protein
MEWPLAAGVERIGKFRIAPVAMAPGEARAEWAVIIADVSEMRSATAALRQEREFSRAIIGASRDGILAFDPDFRALEWNAALERLARRAGHAVLQTPWTALFPFDDPERLAARTRAMLEDGEPFVHQETFGRPEAGMSRIFEFALSPVRDAAGTITGGLCQVRDVTERLLLEGRTIQNAKMDALGLLAAGIAHDFNNSLAAMMGLAELIQMDLPAESPTQGTVRDLLTSTRRARDLVKQILVFARQEPAQLSVLDARDVVAESLRLLRKLIPASIDVQAQLPEQPVPVQGDFAQLQQILINLCTNAEQAMRERRTGTLTVSLGQVDLAAEEAQRLPGMEPGPHARLMVADTGTGMPPDVLARIFDPFFTTKTSGEGTGMGLSMVRRIVEAHAGGIEVSSRAGEGTCVTCWLPLATDRLLPVPEAEPAVPSGGGTIVIVDDEPVLAQLLADALTQFGFRTRAFLRPDDALAAIAAAPDSVDAVVTDQGMPRLTGEELAERLQAVRPGIPVVLLTGYAPLLTPDRLAASGITEVLAKPVSCRRLAEVLVRLTQTGRPQTAAAAPPVHAPLRRAIA